MITPVNNNFSPLPFYKVDGNELDNKYLQSNKPYSYGAVFDMPIAGGWLMPFQFMVDFVVDHVGNCYVIPIGLPSATEAITTPTAVVDQAKGTTVLLFYGEQHGKLPIGRCYIEIELYRSDSLIPEVYMSDIFNNVCVPFGNQLIIPEGYIMLEYTNDHFLRHSGGKIYFDDRKFGFRLLINTTIGKPNYTFEEKASDRLGYRYIESQISNKNYQFTFIAPEYLCDALRLLPMCNSRVISDGLYRYDKVTDVEVSVNWLEQGDLAQVTIAFNNDTVVSNLAEYVSVSPEGLNTNIPVPPTPEVGMPIVQINSLSSVQQNTATVECEAVSDGGGTLEEIGLCWSSESTTPTINDTHVAVSPAMLGQYSADMQSLQPNTVYFCRAYAINEVGVAYSSSLRFTTKQSDVAPTVLTYAATNVQDVLADVSGSVTDEGTSSVTSRGIIYSKTVQMPLIGTEGVSVRVDQHSGVGSYIMRLDGLEPKTTYYYRAYATSSVQTSYGAVMSFMTRDNQPVT